MSKTKIVKQKDGADEAIVGWFRRESKPATPQSMVDGLQSRFSKPVVQKALEQLHEAGTLDAKDFKKVRLYFLKTGAGAGGGAGTIGPVGVPSVGGGGADGDDGDVDGESPADEPSRGEAIALEIGAVDAALAAVAARAQAAMRRTAALAGLRPLASVAADVSEAAAAVAQLEARVAAIPQSDAGATGGADPAELASTACEWAKQWRVRRQLAEDLLRDLGTDVDDLGLSADPPGETPAAVMGSLPAVLLAKRRSDNTR